MLSFSFLLFFLTISLGMRFRGSFVFVTISAKDFVALNLFSLLFYIASNSLSNKILSLSSVLSYFSIVFSIFSTSNSVLSSCIVLLCSLSDSFAISFNISCFASSCFFNLICAIKYLAFSLSKTSLLVSIEVRFGRWGYVWVSWSGQITSESLMKNLSLTAL